MACRSTPLDWRDRVCPGTLVIAAVDLGVPWVDTARHRRASSRVVCVTDTIPRGETQTLCRHPKRRTTARELEHTLCIGTRRHSPRVERLIQRRGALEHVITLLTSHDSNDWLNDLAP
jgi:hypothetical protein